MRSSTTNGSRNRVASIYICHWSLQDPLCQTQTLAYLRELAKVGYSSALITFEQSKYKLETAQRKVVKNELAEEGIYWYPINYYKYLPLLDISYNILRAILKGLWIQLRHHPEIVHPRGSFPSTVALPLSQLCGLKFLYDADSILSEEYADNGHWSRESLNFRFTSWVESVSRKRADSIVVLSKRLRDDFIQEHGIRVPIEVIPCCVDVNIVRFDPQKRQELRCELGLTDERLFIYVGKIGVRYLIDEMFEFFKVAKQRLGRARFLILTGDSPDEFRQAAEKHGVEQNDYFIQYSSREKVGEWLSASDAGFAFIRSAACERASSPVKIGEYLATRLPVVITDAIGDYSDWIFYNHLGVVVKQLDRKNYVDAVERLIALWGDPLLGERCREFAEENLSLKSVAAPRYDKIYKTLIEQIVLNNE